MPTQRSSATIRALKAKLQVLSKPSVWAAAMVLGLPLLFLADYWQHPEKFSLATSGANSNTAGDIATDPATETNTLPTVSDASTILDLPDTTDLSGLSGANALSSDASSLKVDLLARLLSSPSSSSASKPAAVPKSRSNSQPRASRNPFTAGSSQPATAELDHLFSADTTTPTNSAFPSQLGTNSAANDTSSAANSTAENPLQVAIQRILGQPAASEQAAPANTQADVQASSETEATTQTGSNSATPAPTGGQGYGPPSFFQPSFSQPSGFQPSYVPQTSPAPGTTGYTLPPAFRTPTNTPGFYPNATSPNFTTPQIAPTVRTQPIPGSYSGSYGTTPGYGTTAPSPSPNFSAPSSSNAQSQQAPFSVPRTPPGQYIGGGEINTFSNP
ncbi:MAG: hypothetical protein EDM05_62335 [Leptolyngbya sp. IPPAS B-1204]|nr:MAG: hypothetical protein EDM05_03770 [Leptolyngbya sp. IPPAS B-1204]